MRVLMLRPSYVPEISGGTHLAVNLVQDMVEKGIEVVLVVPAPVRADEKLKQKYKDLKIEKQYNGMLTIYRIDISINEKSLLSRALRMIFLTVGMTLRALKTKNIDLIMSHSMPPFLGPVSVLLGKIKRVPVLYWEQDIVSESLLSTGVAKKGIKKKILYSFAKYLERASSVGSDHIVTISQRFYQRQLSIGKDPDKVDVVYNWIDTNNVKPIERKDNILFERFNLDPNAFYVTYCGNLGMPQNVEILVDAAKELQHIKDLKFLIFGNGVRREKIKQHIIDSGIKNITLLPLQPLEETSFVYSVGNVGLVIGRKGTSRNGFPSKTWSILAAGQAIISCFDIDSELSNFVRAGNCGISIPPDDPVSLKKAILELYNNPKKTIQFGRNSREFVSANFSRKAATHKIIRIMEKTINNNIH